MLLLSVGRIAIISSNNGVTILSKRSSYSFQNGCLPNPNGVPTQFERSAYPISTKYLPIFSRVFTRLFECCSSIVRMPFECCFKKDADLFPKRVRPFSEKMPTFSKISFACPVLSCGIVQPELTRIVI